MLVGGYTMDRLEIRQIHPASIPGLVPMGLGVALAFCALLLILSARRELPNVVETQVEKGSYKNLLVTIFLSVSYAAGLVGNIPFVVATAIYIFLFSAYFLWPDNAKDKFARIRIIMLCTVFSLVFAIGISVLFRYGFLVRLP